MEFRTKLKGLGVLTVLPLALVPAAAQACPGAAAGGGACGLMSSGSYVASVVIGLLVGIGSVAFEKSFRKR